MDIEAWLRGLELERYAPAFEANDVDVEVLPKLTADDLIGLGVTSIGHRRKLLEAIAALTTAPAETERFAAQADQAAAAKPARSEAERRQLTVMFVDLVGSTELAARLDPEDMGRVFRAYQACCAEVVKRWGGHVAKYMGDGVLAYFGWPQAHEDEAERAVRAGLELVESVARLSTPAGGKLAARVGIATGLVMVGELIGAGASQEQAVIGETPNLAARLQTLAAPGSVAISQATRRLVGGLFELSDLGPRRLKGFAEPLAAFRVEGEGGAEGRFEALHGERLTPLVGREHELGILLERWAWAKDGDGQVVLLSGEPGIGKSRLLRAFRERLSSESYTPLSHFCSPYHTNSALHPVITQLERAAGLAPGDEPDARLAKLETLLRQATEQLDEVVPLIGALLGVPSGNRYPTLNLTPQRQKQRTFEILIEQLAGLARERPVLELYEDVHWIDPSTLELLDLLVERVRALPVLAVLTFRPEFNPTWTGQAHVTTLTMSRLGRRQGADLVARVTGAKPLPAEVVEQIVARTDGVPLFVEELTKTVLESGLLADAGDRYELSGPLPPLAIPTTLHDSLMARLDRLAPVKEVAQTAAVIGRDFSHELLAAVVLLSQADLNAALEQLVQSGLVFCRGTPPEATYSFKHALVQDAAYQSLLKSKRQQLHARIAEVLAERFPEIVGPQPELLAHHYSEAGLLNQALDSWRRAGEQAARRAATLEASRHFRRALDILQSQPEGRSRETGELQVLTQLGPALMLARGWASAEVGAVYERARELARQLGNPADLVPPLVGSWLFFYSRGSLDAADEAASELFQVAHSLDDSNLLLQAHHAAWPTPMLRGAFATAHEHIHKGLALYDYDRHKHHALIYMGHDPAVCGHSLGAQIVWARGFPEQADRHADAALCLARRLGHAPTLGFALWFVGNAQVARGDSGAALATAEELFSLSEEHGLVQTRAGALAIGGWALAQNGQVEEGLGQLRAALREWHRIGAKPYLQVYTCLLAEACLRARRYAEALEYLGHALAMGEQTGERWWEARVYEVRGKLLQDRRSDPLPAAEQSFQTALQIARAQGARSWELRAATSLARLWAEQGERQQARDLLAPVYGWFTEGFDTADLKDAKALLDELR